MKRQRAHIDDELIQRLLAADSAETAWDTPSTEVWNAIERSISPEKRRRWFAWWIIGGAGALLFAYLLVNNTSKKDVPVQTVDIVSQAQSTEGNLSTPHSDASSGVLHESEQQTEHETEHYRAIKKQEGTIPSAELRTTPAQKSGFESNQPTSNLLNQAERKAEAKAKAKEEAKAKDPDAGVGTSEAKAEEEKNNEARIDPTLPKQSTQAKHVDSERQSDQFAAQQESTRGVEPLDFLTSIIYLKRDLSQLTDYNEGIATGPAPRALTQPWSVTASLSPSLGTRRIEVPSDRPRIRRDLLKQEEEPALQLGFGIQVSRNIASGWSLSAGMDYSRFLLNSSSTHQVRYTRAGERLNDQGNYENNLRLNLNTSYGEVSTDIVVERSSDTPIEENRFIDLSIEAKQSLQILRFPLSLKYAAHINKWSLGCYSGLSANVLLENKLEFKAVQSLNNEILRTSATRNARLANARDFVLGYQCGVEASRSLNKNWSIVISPAISGYLEPVYENRQVRIFPVMADIDLGLRYRF